VKEKAPKSLQPCGNRLRICAKSKRAGIDPAYTALPAQNLPLEAFTASAGEGEEERRGRADIELCLVAPLLESAGRSPLLRSRSCISARPSAPSVELLLHLRLGSPLLMWAFSSPCHFWPSAPAARYRWPSVLQLRAVITVRRSARFESPLPSAGPSARTAPVRALRVCPRLYALCLISCFGSPNLPLFLFVCSAFAHTGACTAAFYIILLACHIPTYGVD
jgi:hypothetical protein